MTPSPDNSTAPCVSVIVVSDYATNSERDHDELRATLDALAHQDLRDTYEVIVCETAATAHASAVGAAAALPRCRVVLSAAVGSQALKNAAVREARAPLIAIVDADVVPAPDWLRRLVAVMATRPEVAVVSGRTFHPDGDFVSRALALLERGYVDRGDAGPTQFIAVHACLFRREWFEAHPCNTAGGPFSSRLQSEAITRAGGQLYFEPSAASYHAYNGWAAQRDIFRNAGAGTITTWKLDPKMRFAWVRRMGAVAIPIVVAAKIATSIRLCLRLFRAYGIQAYEVPRLLLLTALVRCLESPGMWRALRGRAVVDTSFR